MRTPAVLGPYVTRLAAAPLPTGACSSGIIVEHHGNTGRAGTGEGHRRPTEGRMG
ncbi:hypothetical protein B005_1295 [Nocardiopsis alba ATCC BAA-2165]|uniref:Uncharacterized protein n=1 Tax=Nocardiopsis alba (strain ATCC BAA-2165 / BE74) TaxID=1205910 RepID=J7L3C5_NOCAA|nr:hypothetical protein B005_1295 [Nocardiopsis alba ATCC BAA-2165]